MTEDTGKSTRERERRERERERERDTERERGGTEMVRRRRDDMGWLLEWESHNTRLFTLTIFVTHIGSWSLPRFSLAAGYENRKGSIMNCR